VSGKAVAKEKSISNGIKIKKIMMTIIPFPDIFIQFKISFFQLLISISNDKVTARQRR
jgi:hypothetical protein